MFGKDKNMSQKKFFSQFIVGDFDLGGYRIVL